MNVIKTGKVFSFLNLEVLLIIIVVQLFRVRTLRIVGGGDEKKSYEWSLELVLSVRILSPIVS